MFEQFLIWTVVENLSIKKFSNEIYNFFSKRGHKMTSEILFRIRMNPTVLFFCMRSQLFYP